MTKTQIKNLKKWALDCQKPKAWKGIENLTIVDEEKKRELDCCLGRACRLFKLIRTEEDIFGNISYGKTEERKILPIELIPTLGIDSDGSLTEEAINLLKNKFKIKSPCEFYSLVDLNDGIYTSDKTLKRMGKIIHCLAEQEERGTKCFNRP